jgi:tetratricopeptide (TPR) repeat protein
MGHVRMVILNGWKEIGGYVCRDIRTVERWEKYRGLPVRRVPGTGRATVYALISEVDEWLASAKIDGPEEPAGKIAIHVTSAAPEQHHPAAALPESNLVIQNLQPAGMLSLATGDNFRVESFPEISHAAIPPESASPRPMPRSSLLAAVAIACIVAVLAIVWPLMVQAGRRSSAEGLPRVDRTAVDADSVRATPSTLYASAVPGVDDLYLRGIYSYEQRTPASLKHSQQDFTYAIAKDPNYAPAYVGLSNTYNLLREYSGMSDAEAYPRAKAAAEHAIALDPRLPQAHASLAFVDFFWSWNPASAEKEFQTALSLDPASVLAHHWYGSMLVHQGRYAEAIQQLDIALRLQPTSAAIVSLRALAFGSSGHRDEAVARLEEILKEAPAATSPHNVLRSLSLIEPRDIPRYLAETRRVAELRHDREWLQINAVAERAYRSGGEKAMWTSMLEHERRIHPGSSDRGYQMAEAEAALGHPDEAFAVLLKLVDEHNPVVMGIYNDPTLMPLHHDPRFAQVTAKIGLSPLDATQ